MNSTRTFHAKDATDIALRHINSDTEHVINDILRSNWSVWDTVAISGTNKCAVILAQRYGVHSLPVSGATELLPREPFEVSSRDNIATGYLEGLSLSILQQRRPRRCSW